MMATQPRFPATDLRRQVGSPRPKGRENNKDTLCRNVLIYGHCRYEDQGCTFNHDQNKNNSQPDLISSWNDQGGIVDSLESGFDSRGRAIRPSVISHEVYYSAGIDAIEHLAFGKDDWSMSAGRCRAFLNQASGSEKDFESEFRLNKVPSSYLKSASWLGLSYAMPQPHSRSLEATTPPGDVSPRPSRSPPPRTTPRQQDISWSDLTNSSPSSKKTLNVESPSFTPSTLQQPTKKSTFSSQAASAAVFTPRGAGAATPNIPAEPEQPAFNPATIREFTPSNYDLTNTNGASSDSGVSTFDPFSMSTVGQALPATQFNPYANDHASLAGTGAAFYQGQAGYTAPLQPLQYHLYAPIGPYRESLLPYQRLAHDFFMSEKLREDLQKKSHASLQVMPNFQLPQLDNYHTLVPLDTSQRKNANIFGFPSWVYKATSIKSGNIYCLRRLEGYRLTNEHAIRSVKEWKRINNGNVVTTIDAFTTRAFGDSSLVFAQDYHPLSKTLAEQHFAGIQGGGRFRAPERVQESVLWGYIVQISNALKAIHQANLAARCIDISKIILTDKNRIRLNACSILDVVQFEARRPIQELQQEDFQQFGKVILCLATNTQPMHLSNNFNAAVEQLSRNYTAELKDTVAWLLTAVPAGGNPKLVDDLIRGISHHMAASYDMMLHANDSLTSELYRELENGRIVRLMMKLGSINERQEYDNDPAWSENGERYMLKLFRDYVFHRVDENGNPVVDLGHMLRALNKLDAASNESIRLTSRDGETDFIVTYKDLSKQVASAFGDLMKHNRQGRAAF